MILPVIAAFLGVILWIVQVQRAGLKVGQDAREAMELEQWTLDSPAALGASTQLPDVTAQELDTLLRGFVTASRVTTSAGIATGTAELETGEGIPGLVGPAGSTRDQLAVLTNDWSGNVLQFPAGPSQQKPLHLPVQIRGIAPQITKLDEFEQLLDFHGGATGGALRALQHAQNTHAESFSIIESGMQDVRATIAELEDRLRLVVDPQELADLEAQLNESRKHLAALQHAKSFANEAERIGPN